MREKGAMREGKRRGDRRRKKRVSGDKEDRGGREGGDRQRLTDGGGYQKPEGEGKPLKWMGYIPLEQQDLLCLSR